MVSSGYQSVELRNKWRKVISELKEREKIRIVFLVSKCVNNCEHDLKIEFNQYQDIVHTSLLDGHRRLGYKILSGYIWTYLHCPDVGHVVKTDDNVVISMEDLLLLTSTNMPNDSITCGSGTPHRNMKVLRYVLIYSLTIGNKIQLCLNCTHCSRLMFYQSLPRLKV